MPRRKVVQSRDGSLVPEGMQHVADEGEGDAAWRLGRFGEALDEAFVFGRGAA